MPARFNLSLGLLLAGAEYAGGQVVIGHARDDVSGVPLRAVDLRLLAQDRAVRARTLSDSTGRFEVKAPMPGKYRVSASALGYESLESEELELGLGVELELELRLVARGIPLEPIRVVNRRIIRVGFLAEYYERAERTRKTGMGRVYFRDDIDRIGGVTVTSILRTQPTRATCPSTLILLDGLSIPEREIDSLIRPEEIEGIEFYRGLEVPPEYQRRGVCAITLIWTRLDMPGARPMTWRRVFIAVGFVAAVFGLQSLVHE